MDMKLGFLGPYICAAELEGKEPTLTISAIRLEPVEKIKSGEDGASGKIQDMWVVYFAESKKQRGWLLKLTNAEALKAMWGSDVNGWIGHQVTLHTQMVRVGAKMKLGIRVKGSPELESDLTFELALPRKKPQKVTLVKTVGNRGKQNAVPA